MVADTLSRLPSAKSKPVDPITRQVQLCANNLFTVTAQNPDGGVLLILFIVQEEKKRNWINQIQQSKLTWMTHNQVITSRILMISISFSIRIEFMCQQVFVDV